MTNLWRKILQIASAIAVLLFVIFFMDGILFYVASVFGPVFFVWIIAEGLDYYKRWKKRRERSGKNA